MRYRYWGVAALLFFCQLHILAQQQWVTATFERAPLQEVFQQFETEYGLQLAYEPKILAARYVSVELQQETVLSALFLVLESAGLDYLTVAENKILIRPQSAAPPPPMQYMKLSGQLRDARTGDVLPYASVQWVGTSVGRCADEQGRFELLLPDTVQQFSLRASYIGYRSQRMDFSALPRHSLRLELVPDTITVPTVIVVERFPYLSQDVKAQSNTLRPQANLPGLGGQLDPMRQMQLLPGIAAYNDFSTGLQVRGGMPDENYMEWDGMVLYQLDHFFGIFSAVSGDLVEQVRLYKNSFPAEYGGRISSVVAIESPAAQPEAPSGNLSISNIIASGDIDMPISSNMSLMLGGRATLPGLGSSSLFNAFQQQIDEPEVGSDLPLRDRVVGIRPAFSFYDAFAKYRWQIGEETQLQANLFLSSDAYDYTYGFQFRTLDQRRLVLNDNTVTEEATWDNRAGSLRLSHRWNAAWSSRWDLSYSQYGEEELTRTNLTRSQMGETPDVFETQNIRNNQLEAVHLKWVNDWRPDSTQHYQWGYRYSYELTTLQLQNDDSPILNREADGGQHALFASGAYTADRLFWSWALHATYFQPTSSLHLSPRVKGTLSLDEHWSASLSLSRYHQFLRRYYFENRFGRSVAVWTMANERMFPIAHSNQATLGGRFAKAAWSVDAALFYKYTEGSLQQASTIGGLGSEGDPRPQNMDFRIFQGDGQNYGLEVLLQHNGERFTNWLSYTLSRSLQRYPQAFRNAWFPTQEDRPHQLQWNGQYRLNNWSFHGTYVWATGAPYFDGSLRTALEERQLAQPDAYQRIDDYHRVDIGLAYQFDWEKCDLQLGASVYNVLDHTNALYRQQFFGINLADAGGIRRTAVIGNELELLGRTLSVSLKLSW